ncbi:MAG: alpha/beta hydrolase [Abitibacteriaceae bacterium]|nr:alpha/beta hydrolase [Abditibacteriaceae bacterium]MBV9865984.1 alpha/beta hydrolase [Abditibacteriaceae bacterium]
MALPATLILIVAIVYIVAHLIADKLIFQPPVCCYGEFKVTMLKTVTGNDVSALYLPNSRACYTILYSYGNGADLKGIYWLLEKLKSLGFSVFAFDYPGYGKSTGKPSESSLYEAIDAVYAYLTSELGIAPNRIIAYGHSLGGAVALDLASRQLLAGLILEGAFVTAFRVLTYWPISPFDKFQNLRKIKNVQCPILVMHGQCDSIVRPWHGQQLFALAPEPKRSLWVEHAGHNDFIEVASNLYDKALLDFGESLSRPS